ncbi:MAG: hypothetical protein AAFY31_01850 [Pseudomonadota bacterium]
MPLPARPLLASYGGGHANIIIAVAHALIAYGIDPTLIGFTTAYQAYLRAGLRAKNVSVLIESRMEDYDEARLIALQFLPQQTHPDITQQETGDYFAIGLHDLIARLGREEALRHMRHEGRAAFEPIATMEAYLRELQPSCIVTTTSPRFELALIRAGRRLGIPTIAIADIYLQRERSWVLSGDYADHLCVLNTALRDELQRHGPIGTKVYATGNPAFDQIASLRKQTERRNTLRAKLGLSDETLILWPSASVRQADFADRPFASPAEVTAAMEKLCSTRADYAYLLRPHPNAPYLLPEGAENGILDPGLMPEEAILISDVVCFEVSTMGLQAHLAGLPTICVGFQEIAVFPKYDKALIADNLDDMVNLLAKRDLDTLKQEAASSNTVKRATPRVVELIEEVTKQHYQK